MQKDEATARLSIVCHFDDMIKMHKADLHRRRIENARRIGPVRALQFSGEDSDRFLGMRGSSFFIPPLLLYHYSDNHRFISMSFLNDPL